MSKTKKSKVNMKKKIDNLPGEKWKTVDSFGDGVFEVSNKGRLKLFASGEIRQIASVEKRQFGSAEIRQFESIEKSQS